MIPVAFGLLPLAPQYTVSYAYLGIDGKDVPKRGGVEVVGADPGSPATAVLRAGDIVLFWNGLPTRTLESLLDLVERHEPGDRVTLHVRRGDEELEVLVELLDAARLCEEGLGATCSLLAWRHQKASFDDGYPVAAKLYERACDLGFLPGCGNLANMYFFGNGVEKDRVRSTSMFAKLCEAEVSYACLSLGEAYLSGDGIEADEDRGIELLTWSCEHGQPYGCSSLGYYYANGRHVARDRSLAADFYRKACEGGWTSSCEDWWYLERHRDPEGEREAQTFPNATPEIDEALFEAVDARDLKEVERLLAAGANPNVRGDLGDLHDIRAIIGAFFTGELEIVHALLDAGADVQGEESNPFDTPLTAAIARGDLKTVDRIIQLGARVRNGDLGQAADGGTPDIMRRLMQEGITVDDLYLDSMPVIFAAARRRELENIDFLVANGADIDAFETNGDGSPGHSALTYVLDEGDAETAAHLLARGADPDMTNGEGRAPLHYAAAKGMAETVSLLLEHGADPDIVDDEGVSVLLFAVMTHQTEMVRALLLGGASPAKPDPNGATPLIYAAALGNESICEILLERDAAVNAVAKSGILGGKSALDLARLGGFDEIVKRLIAAGAADPL